MGQGKWKSRKPGSISGTMVPPPATPASAESPDLPPLPQRRRGESIAGRPEALPPQLPDNVRSLFKPVLARDAGADPPSARPAARRATKATARPAPDHPDRAGRHIRWLVALIGLVLLTAAGTALVLIGVWGPATRPGPATAQLTSAAAVRTQAVGWIVREVSRGAYIACDKVMCEALYHAGMPSSNLLAISPGAPDPLGADVIVATPVIRGLFGSRLASEYAPSVLASFGHGAGSVQLRVLAADGAAAYEAALSQDLGARRRAGAQLLGNRRIAVPQVARGQLAGGRVDPRILLTLAALAAQRPIRVLAFYDLPPGAGPGIPLSGVRLAGSDSQAGLTSTAYQRWLVSFLRSQTAPYRAAAITSAATKGHPIVSVRFTRPSPLGLLHLVGGITMSSKISAVFRRSARLAAPAICALWLLTAAGTGAASAAAGAGWLRLAHLSPNTPAVDVYLYSFGNPRAMIVLHHVAYGTISGYERVRSGEYTVAMRLAGAPASSAPVLSTAVNVQPGAAYTVAGMGPAKGLRLQILRDRLVTPRGRALVRIIQASLIEHRVTVRAGGHVLVAGLPFAAVTSYRPVRPGAWLVTAVGQTERTQGSITLSAGTIHTIVVLDDPGKLMLDDLVDAAGSRVIPAGAPATGLGGTAPLPRPGALRWLVLIGGGLLLAMAGGRWAIKPIGRHALLNRRAATERSG
jgi:hypothetical protein